MLPVAFLDSTISPASGVVFFNLRANSHAVSFADHCAFLLMLTVQVSDGVYDCLEPPLSTGSYRLETLQERRPLTTDAAIASAFLIQATFGPTQVSVVGRFPASLRPLFFPSFSPSSGPSVSCRAPPPHRLNSTAT